MVWEHFNGPIQEGTFVEHIDGDFQNCRICNLKLHTNPPIDDFVYVGDGIYYEKATGKPWSNRGHDGKFFPLNTFNHCGYYILQVREEHSTAPRKTVNWHRYIWEHFKGPIPYGMQIDHINRNRKDNRIENLRCVERYVNAINSTVSSVSSIGFKGVFKSHSKRGKFCATIHPRRENIYIGYSYDSPFEAARAYDEEASKHEGYATNKDLGLYVDDYDDRGYKFRPVKIHDHWTIVNANHKLMIEAKFDSAEEAWEKFVESCNTKIRTYQTALDSALETIKNIEEENVECAT